MALDQGFEPLSKWEMAHINLLPEFSGTSSCNLDYFLAQSETFLRNFQRPAQTPNAELTNAFLFNVIKSKLKNEAQSVLDIETNSNFSILKERLIRKYGDARDEHILFREISNCCQLRNENLQDYYDRLNHLLVKYKVTLKLNYQSPILEMKLQEGDTKCLNAFRAGVLNPYREYLRYANLTDLSQAFRSCRDYDNERAYENYMDSLRNNQKPNLLPHNQQFKTSKPPEFPFSNHFSTPRPSGFTPPRFPQNPPPPNRLEQNRTQNIQPQIRTGTDLHNNRFSQNQQTQSFR